MYNSTLRNKVQGTNRSDKTHTFQNWNSDILATDLSKWQAQRMKQVMQP